MRDVNQDQVRRFGSSVNTRRGICRAILIGDKARKTDRVYTRQSEQHTPQSWLFWCKHHADMHFKSEKAQHSKYDAAGILSLCLALLHARAGEMVSYGGLHEFGHSERTLRRFEEFLQSSDSEPPPLSAPKHAGAMLFSDFLEPLDVLEDQLRPLAGKSRNGWLIQTLDPAEIELPYDGARIV